jgi:hypothetical protein
MSQTRTASATYTVVDVENVVRRTKADLVMIGDSTGAWTPSEATNYAHDIEVLAKGGYLAWVDVTLLYNGVEVKAVRFEVDTNAGSLTTSRPGGVLWPRVSGGYLRVIVGYTDAYTATAREATKSKMKLGWGPSNADTSHANLNSSGGRNYVSNAYAMQRKDWAA